jgi:hypothetical protein
VPISAEEAIQLLSAYHALMAIGLPIIADECLLPGGKAKLKTALILAMATARTSEEREHWRVGYLFLSHFLPGVGPVSAEDDVVELLVTWGEAWKREQERVNCELDVIDAELRRVGFY